METRIYLTERWTISRGRDTYGYNVCTVQTTSLTGRDMLNLRATCKGGGYDMAGTSLADVLTQIPEIQARLKRAFPRLKEGLYGLSERKDGSIDLDGACGQQNVINVMQEVGVKVSPNYRRKRNGRDERIGWFVTIEDEIGGFVTQYEPVLGSTKAGG